MTGIFKQKTPANIFVLLILGILVKLPMFLEPRIPVTRPGDGILFREILDYLEPAGRNSPIIYPLLSFTFLFVTAVLLTLFLNRQRMLSHSTWYPGMAYMLITSLLPEWNYFSAALVVNVILVLILSGLFRIYHMQRAQGAVFNIGLGLGIASFLFFPVLSFILWILLSLAIMRPFRLREWLLCLVGVMTPYYFYSVYLLFTDEWNWAKLFPSFTIGWPYVKQSAWLAGSAFLIVLPFLTGGFYVQESLRRILIQVRKGWSLLLLYLLSALFIPFVYGTENFENWIMITVPLAAFHACTYLYSSYRIYPLLLFWLSIAFIVSYQYYGPGW